MSLRVVYLYKMLRVTAETAAYARNHDKQCCARSLLDFVMYTIRVLLVNTSSILRLYQEEYLLRKIVFNGATK
jgi:hypothetical protein